MKTYIPLTCALFLCSILFCSAQDNSISLEPPTTTITFDEVKYDYGVIDQGDIVEHTFTFTNTGSEPLVISNAKGSCGCTVPDWKKEPIAPGETGEIFVRFDSKNKKGRDSKRVTVTTNTSPPETFLFIEGGIKAPEGTEIAEHKAVKPEEDVEKNFMTRLLDSFKGMAQRNSIPPVKDDSKADDLIVSSNPPDEPTTTIIFDKVKYDFGMIDQGDIVKHIYSFTNTGNEPLVISNAKGSCGCTVPDWKKEPIAPGETGEIVVQFDSKGKKGIQSKRVTVTANTNPAQSYLTIKGEIKTLEDPTLTIKDNTQTNDLPVSPNPPDEPTTTITFDKVKHDFGMIDQGDIVKQIYSFTNTGNEPLVISNAKGSCGCTVPNWKKEPIAPGETGEIVVQFDSKGKKGIQSKRVTVTANTNPPQSYLTIKGDIKISEKPEGTK